MTKVFVSVEIETEELQDEKLLEHIIRAAIIKAFFTDIKVKKLTVRKL